VTISCDDLLVRNSVAVYLIGVEVDGVPLNDAICVLTLLDANDVAVIGADGLPMSYLGTPGSYRGVLPHSLPLVPKDRYKIRATATKDGVGVGEWECDKVAVRRGCN